MRIAHWAPYAPCRCGLYEAARDIAHADAMRGHEVAFVDTGTQTALGGTKEFSPIGTEDTRAGWTLKTSDPLSVMDFDLWACHDGIQDAYAARTQVPMVWFIHGRPRICFWPEQEGHKGRPYTLWSDLASWPRVKKIITMWREFLPHWSVIVPPEKLRCTDDPPIDRERYSQTGPVYPISPDRRGSVNVLLCDSWRDDIDIYEASIGCIEAAKMRKGLRFHFWACEPGKQNPWQYVWAALRKLDALGELHERDTQIAYVYRGMDLLVSPHVIGVRTIGEGMACGLPCVAGDGNRYTPFTGRPSDAEDFGRAIVQAADGVKESPDRLRVMAREMSAAFDLERFGKKVEAIYQEAINGPSER